MSGGIAYVLNEEDEFEQRCNMGMVELEKVRGTADQSLLRDADRVPFDIPAAGRPTGTWIIGSHGAKFVKIMPIDYKRVLAERKAAAVKERAQKDMVAHG